jgi:Tol biopolymer transport system component
MLDADDPGAARSMTYGVQHYYGSLTPEGLGLIYSGFREKDVYEIYELGWREGTLASAQYKQLTDHMGVLNAPEISPDGGKIVFARHVPETDLDEIWLMHRDGTEQHRLLDAHGWDPTWSPGGDQILFASDRGGSTQLWMVRLDGSGLRQVSDLPAVRGRSDWSPDGRYIVVDSGGPWDHEIYLMNADGSNAHRISPAGGNSQGPSFSPDGQWVAFTSYFDHPYDANGCEIYIMRIDGADLRRMTNNDFCDYQPRWSP